MSNLLMNILGEYKDATEETITGLILPSLLKDVDYLLDMFTFCPNSIVYDKNYLHTNYKVPNGLNYDAFVKAEPMRITIEDAFFNSLTFSDLASLDIKKNIINSSNGINEGGSDVIKLKFLGAQQTKVPILLKTTKYVGVVLVEKWTVKERATESYFDITLIETSLW